MSAIAGYLAPTPPADPDALLEALAAPLARRGPDGCRAAHRGRAGMLHRPFLSRPGSAETQQPLLSRHGVLLAWDGRLDDERGAGEGADAARAMTAYERWGADFADHLVGDFAAAVWDPRQERLLLARDPFSDRTLFYGRTAGGLFLWASNLTAVHRAGGLNDDLDEEWITGFLTNLMPEGRTVFRAVRTVPPGHVLQVHRGGAHLHRYWPGDHVREVRHAGDREYEEEFRVLLTDAVRHRLRRRGPAFAELSGGLDSSSVVCLADRLLRDEGAPRQDLWTCSYVFDDAGGSDEREHMRHVEARVRRPALHVSERQAPILAGFTEPWGEQPTRTGTFRQRALYLGRRMAQVGARVVLSGTAGDNIGLSEPGAPPQLTDLAAAGRLPSLWRETRRWRRATDLPYSALAWYTLVLPFLPALLRARLGHVPDHGRWLGGRLSGGWGLSRRATLLHPGEPEAGMDRPSMRERSASLRYAIREGVQARYQVTELTGIERRLPFLHRPLVEFSLGLPIDQLLRPGESRSLHRRAMAGVIPPEIARRRSKAGPDQAFTQALEREWAQISALFSGDARVYDAGWVERQPFLDALERARFGLLHQAGPINNVLELESWLRHHATNSASPLVAQG